MSDNHACAAETATSSAPDPAREVPGEDAIRSVSRIRKDTIFFHDSSFFSICIAGTLNLGSDSKRPVNAYYHKENIFPDIVFQSGVNLILSRSPVAFYELNEEG